MLLDDEKPAAYEPRYCAFIDILGFSEKIKSLGPEPAGVDEVRRLLLTVRNPPASSDQISSYGNSDFKSQSISDAICLSASCSSIGLLHLFHSIDRLTLALLEAGYFVRGAIVKGLLYHDESMAFGDALIRAYLLEKEIVRFPRVLVTHDIVRDVNGDYINGRDAALFRNRLRQSEDGPHYLHVLNEPSANAGNDSEKMRLNCMADHIQRKLEGAVDNPSHFEKVQWIANYWNDTFGKYTPSVKAIQGPGVGPAQQW